MITVIPPDDPRYIPRVKRPPHPPRLDRPTRAERWARLWWGPDHATMSKADKRALLWPSVLGLTVGLVGLGLLGLVVYGIVRHPAALSIIPLGLLVIGGWWLLARHSWEKDVRRQQYRNAVRREAADRDRWGR